jgi:LacI family transcriptional regulator, repressor for deo operon, udp, cdd, tsx, nupC, and nupG
MERRGPTGWEVAREAGVSQSTVSLVLSGRAAGRVAAATQERVREAALRLGYRPHAAARSLRSGRSGLVVLMVPQVRNPLNPFFPRVMDGAEQAAYEHGYSLVLAFGRRGPIFEVAAAVDGIIACSQPLPELRHPLPAVVLDHTAAREVPSVRMDVAGGMAEAVRHLAELGHTRIGHVRSVFATPTFQARARAFRRAAARLDTAEVTADLSAPAAEQAVADLLADGRARPTAVVCDDDLQAAGVYRAAHRLGLRIPDQLSVVSFGNTDVATMLAPGLTTVDLPGEELGRAGMTLLVEQLAGGVPRTRSTLPARLQVRDSTARPA